MTVAQLIQLLQQFPDDMAVLVEGYENGYDPIHSLSIQELAGVQNAADYDGLFVSVQPSHLPKLYHMVHG
ncbi:hypothetical protein [Stutzerimonas kunmingensis]|uniref:hypothetical protein n=1 Tax=Stutzerimonas kunmingensis TaxID=1211807 RepID=UPI0028A5EA4A|nr:hypothetical protein [Stutzerimonas kunmingensis]